jgi:hypothetical protein
MRRAALIFGFGSASLAIGALCGCSWKELAQPQPDSVANDVALDRALRVSSLTDGDQPFHLILDISPPPRSNSRAFGESGMYAQVEVFWLNRITYRIVIRSKTFSQIRIVNGRVVEEHDTGNFYPRWIQNFVDALFEPVPKKSILLKIPGSIPVGPTANACIATPSGSDPEMAAGLPRSSDEISLASVCFRDREPRIASGRDYARYVAFDNFAPFGQQQIPRTLVNVLPANILLRGRVTHLEPLRQSDYPLLKAKEFTLPAKQILTTLVSQQVAESLLETPLAHLPASHSTTSTGPLIPSTIYIRTDRTGKVREAYRNSTDQFHQQDALVSRALTLKFKPLVVKGVPQQMEAPFALP